MVTFDQGYLPNIEFYFRLSVENDARRNHWHVEFSNLQSSNPSSMVPYFVCADLVFVSFLSGAMKGLVFSGVCSVQKRACLRGAFVYKQCSVWGHLLVSRESLSRRLPAPGGMCTVADVIESRYIPETRVTIISRDSLLTTLTLCILAPNAREIRRALCQTRVDPR